MNYRLAGILLITIASGISYTPFRLFLDMKRGIFERFQSMPIARSSFLWAHVLTSLVANLISLVVVVGVALVMGFRSGTGVLAWLVVAGILVLFTLALTWIAVIPGLAAKSPDGANAFAYPLIFLPGHLPPQDLRDKCVHGPVRSCSRQALPCGRARRPGFGDRGRPPSGHPQGAACLVWGTSSPRCAC